MKRYEIKHLLKEDVSALLGTTICVKGWVRTKRGNKNVAFLAVNDGSIIHNIQVVADPAKFEEELKRITTGACIGVEGKLLEKYKADFLEQGGIKEQMSQARRNWREEHGMGYLNGKNGNYGSYGNYGKN